MVSIDMGRASSELFDVYVPTGNGWKVERYPQDYPDVEENAELWRRTESADIDLFTWQWPEQLRDYFSLTNKSVAVARVLGRQAVTTATNQNTSAEQIFEWIQENANQERLQRRWQQKGIQIALEEGPDAFRDFRFNKTRSACARFWRPVIEEAIGVPMPGNDAYIGLAIRAGIHQRSRRLFSEGKCYESLVLDGGVYIHIPAQKVEGFPEGVTVGKRNTEKDEEVDFETFVKSLPEGVQKSMFSEAPYSRETLQPKAFHAIWEMMGRREDVSLSFWDVRDADSRWPYSNSFGISNRDYTAGEILDSMSEQVIRNFDAKREKEVRKIIGDDPTKIIAAAILPYVPVWAGPEVLEQALNTTYRVVAAERLMKADPLAAQILFAEAKSAQPVVVIQKVII